MQLGHVLDMQKCTVVISCNFQPERLLTNAAYDIRSDVWSLGITLVRSLQEYLELESDKKNLGRI